MTYETIDHFLTHAYVDEEYVIVSQGSFGDEELCQKMGLTPQEKALYFATVRKLISEAFKNDDDCLNCIRAKYGVGHAFIQAVAFLTQKISSCEQTMSRGCCLFELVKYTHDGKKNLRQISNEFDVSIKVLGRDKRFIDDYISAIEYRAMQKVEKVLHQYLSDAILLSCCKV